MENTEIFPGFKNIDEFAEMFMGAVMATNKATNNLPNIEDDYSDPSYDTYRQIMNGTGQRLLSMAEDVLRYHGIGSGIFTGNEGMDFDDRFNVLVDANMELFDRIGTLLDEASGIKKDDVSLVVVSRTPKQLTPGLKLSKSITRKSDSNDRSFHMLTARNITKPQLEFREKVDNSNRPFVPKLTQKPNALKSLEETMNICLPEDYESDPSFSFPHPYKYELENFVPDQRLFERAVAQVPRSLDETPLTLIDNVEELMKLNQRLKTVREFAVDLEHHSFRSFLGFTCLMQISTREEDYIVDTLVLHDDLQILNEVFTDPQILKVFHGSNSDIDWLQKDFGLYVVNMFDSGQAARLLGFPRLSLAYLLKHYCNEDADKKYQAADWRTRPLPEEMIKYARADTHYLLYIYDCMKNDLLHRDNGQTTLLLSAFQNSTRLCMKNYEKPRITEESYEEFYRHELNKRHNEGARGRPIQNFNNQQMEALKSLFVWRDTMARQHDESTGYVLPNHMMLQICELLPKEPAGIFAICVPKPPLVHMCVDDIHRMIQKARQKSLVAIETSRPELKPTRLQHPHYQANSLLDCPHDPSSQDKRQGLMEDSLVGNLDKISCDPNKATLSIKEKFSGNGRNDKTRLPDLISSFDDPFDIYLPGDLLSKKYTGGQRSDIKSEKEEWKLLPNTCAQVPVVNEAKTVIQDANESTDIVRERIPECSSLRDMVNSERKRTHEEVQSPNTVSLKKKERHEKKLNSSTDGDFQPHNYGSSSIAKLLGDARAMLDSNSSSKKKKKEYDPNLEIADSDFKAAPRPRLNPVHGNRTMTYSSKGGSAGATPRIQWPKK